MRADRQCPPLRTSQLLTSRYTDLAEVKEEQLKQNESMRAAVATYDDFIRKKERFIVPKADELLPNQFTISLRDTTALMVEEPDFVVPSLREPFTVEFCQQMAKQTYTETALFLESASFKTTGISVYGWRDKRLDEGEWVKYHFTKTFANITTEDMATRGWEVLSSAEMNQQLHSAQMNPRVYTIQEVDEKNTVLLRVLTGPDRPSLVKFLFLASLMETPTGYCVILRWLDSDLHAPQPHRPGLQEYWMGCYGWVTFDRAGGVDQHCVTGVGGEVYATAAINSDAWMVEVLFYSLRFESLAVGLNFSSGRTAFLESD